MRRRCTHQERQEVKHGHDGQDPYVQFPPDGLLESLVDGHFAADAAHIDILFLLQLVSGMVHHGGILHGR